MAGKGKQVWEFGSHEVCEFSENDWSYLAGAERFADGSEPIICGMDECIVVGAGDGVEVVMAGDDKSFLLPIVGLTQKMSALLVALVVTEILPYVDEERDAARVFKGYGFVQAVG